jgi:hypothetical protein
MAAQARARVFSTAMRRVVVTPTFAAGLGVVIAAVLAYPMARTVISYGPRPPARVAPCLVSGCGSGTQDGGGGLATARPGKRLASPAPAVKHPQPSPPPAASGNGAPAPALQPVMQYQTLHQWQGGFVGEVTITGPGVQPSAHWQLRISYGSARIIGVWGGHWTSRGDHAALVTPDSGDGLGGGEGGNVQVILAVSGSPGPPSGCSFNGQACRTGQAGQVPGPGSSQQGSSQPGSPQQGNPGQDGSQGR